MMNQGDLKHEYAQIGSVRLHYAQAGNGEKLVLLLHGFPEFWYSWRHQMVALSDDFTIIAPDMRGYNLSDKPPNIADYQTDKLVDDVLGLIRHFGREKAAIVGHDWGATVAWTVAQKHPEMVGKLAALQVPPVQVWRKNQSLRQFLTSWYMFLFQLPVLPEWIASRNDFALLEESLRTKTVRKDVFTDADIAEYKKSWREENSLSSAINYYRANVFSRFLAPRDDLNEKIKVPTLFIYGEKDFAILPETVKNVGEFIDAPFTEIRIPDAGHWVQQEAAEEVNAVLRDFLND
jgi:pimeloyl-ACP methyl ester carboxylesterase